MTKRQRIKLEKKLSELTLLKAASEDHENLIRALFRDQTELKMAINDYKNMLHRMPIMKLWSQFKDEPDGKYIIYWRGEKSNHPYCRIIDKRDGILYLNERSERFPIEKIKPVAYLQLPLFPEALNEKRL